MYSSGLVMESLDEFVNKSGSIWSSLSMKSPVLLNAQFCALWKKFEGPLVSVSASYAVVPLIVTAFPPQFI
jgi:hypothetical protein